MIVADTNLISYLALPSPYTEQADQLYKQDSHWIAPCLWRSEFRNVLALYLRKSQLNFSQALIIQAEMESLFNGREFQLPSLDVLSLVDDSDCSTYDCEFVALAQASNSPLITMDRKLAQAFPDNVRLLTDATWSDS